MLNKKKLDGIKAELLRRQHELKIRIESISKEPVTDNEIKDEGDKIINEVSENLKNSLQDTEYLEYEMIKDALKSIELGTYGICLECESEISKKRLEFYPNAKRCIYCQEKLENL